MNRKEFLKNVSAIGAITLLPNFLFSKGITNSHQLHFIGMGGGGSNALLTFYRRNIKGTYSIINSTLYVEKFVNTDIKYYNWTDEPIDRKNWNKLKHNLQKETSRTVNDSDHFILLTGIGGSTGTSLAIALHCLLSYENIKHTIICTIPFSFEGPRRAIVAKQFINCTKSIPNFKYVYADTLRTKYPGLKMIDAMKTLDNEMYEACINECKLIYPNT